MDLVIPNDFVSGDHARIVPGKLMRDLHRGSQAYHAELHSHVSLERVMMPQSQTLMLFPNSMWKRLSFDHCFFGKLESALRSFCQRSFCGFPQCFSSYAVIHQRAPCQRWKFTIDCPGMLMSAI